MCAIDKTIKTQQKVHQRGGYQFRHIGQRSHSHSECLGQVKRNTKKKNEHNGTEERTQFSTYPEFD